MEGLARKAVGIFLGLVLCQTLSALDLYGHRGARGLLPENTLPAYRAAMAIGVDYLDMDVGMTREGVLVVVHDLALDPDITRDPEGHWLTDHHHYIHDMSLSEIKRYDVGAIKPGSHYAMLFPDQRAIPGTRIPTLEEVIDYAEKASHHQIKYQIEMKTDPLRAERSASPEVMAARLAALLMQKHLVDRVEVQAFDFRCLRALQAINPRIKTAYLTEASNRLMYAKDPKVAGTWTAGWQLSQFQHSVPRLVKAMGGACWDPEQDTLTHSALEEAHRLGLRVVVWEEVSKKPPPQVFWIERMIHWGVDGIITDRPDVVRGLLAAEGKSIPSGLSPL